MAERISITVPKKTPWLFESFAAKNLKKATVEFLAARKTGLLDMEAAEALAVLHQEKHALAADFVKGLGGGVHYVRKNPLFDWLLTEVALPGIGVGGYDFPLPAPPPTAAERGIKPLGIGDLLVVRQELMKYTAGELYIENVLKSEFKTRTNIRIRETEEIVITETEQMEESGYWQRPPSGSRCRKKRRSRSRSR